MREGLLLGVSHILTNAPYFVLAYMMFRQHRRYSVKLTAAALGAFVLVHGASSYLLTVFYHGEIHWQHIQFAVFCVGLGAILLILFRISFSKAFYAFLLIRAMYTAILYTILNAFMLAFPGVYIGFDQTPLFTLAVILANAALFPLLWKFTTGRLCAALTVLDEKTFRQLCIPPALFFLLDQCYSSIRSTLEYESFQTAMIFLLILATGLVTYYVNLRMVMESRERVRIEEEKEALDRLNTLKNDLIATLSHEMRTPLTVMSNYAQLAVGAIEKGDYSDASLERLGIITKEAERLARLSENFLMAFKEPGSARRKEAVSVSEIISHTALVYKPIMDKKNNRQTLDVSADIPPVHGNAEDLTQVLFNLLANAQAHTKDGEIKISAGQSGEFVTVTVSDTGSGIANELLPHIFERGVHGNNGGSGFGLAVCKEIIGEHGGEIWVEERNSLASEALGEGTTVSFTLPVFEIENGGYCARCYPA